MQNHGWYILFSQSPFLLQSFASHACQIYPISFRVSRLGFVVQSWRHRRMSQVRLYFCVDGDEALYYDAASNNVSIGLVILEANPDTVLLHSLISFPFSNSLSYNTVIDQMHPRPKKILRQIAAKYGIHIPFRKAIWDKKKQKKWEWNKIVCDLRVTHLNTTKYSPKDTHHSNI